MVYSLRLKMLNYVAFSVFASLERFSPLSFKSKEMGEKTQVESLRKKKVIRNFLREVIRE